MNLSRRGALTSIAAVCSAAGAAPNADTEIVAAQVGPFTGLPVPDAHELNAGIRAAFAQVNARGGIGGRRLTLFEVDDTYTGDGFVRAFEQALTRRPVALLSPVGSVALKRMLDDRLLDRREMVVINAVPGAESLRNPGHPLLFHVRAGDRQQIDKIVNHARTLGITKVAVLHQDIPIGTSGLAVAQQAANGTGMELMPFMSTLAAPDIAAAAGKVRTWEPQAVLVLGAPRFMADGVAGLRAAGVGQFIFALSYVPPALLSKVAGAGARGVALAQTYPNPNGISLPLQREFRAAMASTHPDLTTYGSFHLEGYLSARVLAEATRRAREISATGIATALRTMGEVDFGGFRVDFSKGNAGGRFVDIGVVDSNGRLVF